MRTTGGEKNGLTGGATHAPAIWIYPKDRKPLDVEIELSFHGAGFMTTSTPEYNQLWRVHVDPRVPYNQYSSTYVDDAWVPFLDYDGFRDGSFQTRRGWCVRNEKDAVVQWHRTILAEEYGFTETEIDDINCSYVRMLMDRQYKQKFFLVYPQDAAVVNSSVSLQVTPPPDSISRLWLYFVPANEAPKGLERPAITRIARRGYSVIECAYLTDREIPRDIDHPRPAAGNRLLGHPGAPWMTSTEAL